MERDIGTLTPVAVLVVIVVLVWAFRTVRGVVIPLATVAVGLVWTIGLMVLFGSPINMGTLVLPPLLITIGVAYSIPFVSLYYQELQTGRSAPQVVTATLERVGVPIAVCALTTMIGFAPFAFSRSAIWDFGVYSIFGVLASSPPSRWRRRCSRSGRCPHLPSHDDSGWLARLLERIGAGRSATGAGLSRHRGRLRRVPPRRPASTSSPTTCPSSARTVRCDARRAAIAEHSPARSRSTSSSTATSIDHQAKTLAAIKGYRPIFSEQPGVDPCRSSTTSGCCDMLSMRVQQLAAADAGGVDQLFLFITPTTSSRSSPRTGRAPTSSCASCRDRAR